MAGTPPPTSSATPDARLYRRLIDWDRRLAREGPSLLSLLAVEPGSRLLDLGCGSGEHDRFLAGRGAHVIGVDRSEDMLRAAREAAAGDGRLRYVEADIAALPDAVAGRFDGALCLGNTLVHLLDLEQVRGFFRGVGTRLRDGGRLLLQILNYEAIVAEKRRAFPPALQPGDDGEELAFLRFLDHREPGFVEFESVVLARRDDADTRLVMARRSRLRAWTRAELVAIAEAEVGATAAYGTIEGEPFDPRHSPDLVLVARAERSRAGD